MTVATTKLENGLTVVTEQMPGSRSVAVGVMVAAGPREEPGDKAGLAHLVEHSLFHGTSSRTSGDIARMIDTMGGRVSAFTGRDYTCFSGIVMDDHRTYILDLFSDMLLNSIFPDERLENEKHVIANEYEMERGNPSQQVLTALKAAIWPGHPLGREIEGLPQTVAGMNREDVIYFLHSHYLPPRMIIALAGNLEHEDIVAQVRDCFWRLTGDTSPASANPAKFTSNFVHQQASGKQAYFAVGIEAPRYAHGDRYTMHLFNTILGGGMSSRLYRELREERGQVYDVHSEYHAYADGGTLVVSGSSHAETVFGVVDEVIRIGGAMASGQEPVNEEELWQAKLYNIGQYHIDSEDPYTRMSRLLNQQFYFSRIIPSSEIVGRLEQVSTGSMAEASSRLLDGFTGKVAAVVVGGQA